MNEDPIDPPRTFLQKYGFALGVGAAIAVIVVVVGSQLFHQRKTPITRKQQIEMVRLLPAPPPPPPPPPPPKMEEPKMVEQQPVDNDEPKPDNTPKEAPANVGTNIAGNGPADAFGLHGGGGGGFYAGGGGRHSSRWGWYAGEVQTAISDALRRNPVTRVAQFRVEVKVWPDSVGLITRARLVGTTGDTALDTAIRDHVLVGLQLREPPPSGMPMPIVMRLTAGRPG